MKYCNKCKESTVHIKTNSTGEVAAKTVVGVLTMGMSIGLMPTEYQCVKCGTKREG